MIVLHNLFRLFKSSNNYIAKIQITLFEHFLHIYNIWLMYSKTKSAQKNKNINWSLRLKKKIFWVMQALRISTWLCLLGESLNSPPLLVPLGLIQIRQNFQNPGFLVESLDQAKCLLGVSSRSKRKIGRSAPDHSTFSPPTVARNVYANKSAGKCTLRSKGGCLPPRIVPLPKN